MSSILPVDVTLTEEAHVGFVDDDSGLHPIVTPFTGEMPRRQCVQLVVDQWHQPIEGVLAAVPNRAADA